MNKLKSYLPLVIIVFLGFLLRFHQVAEVPPGISHDELEYINNGYSIIKTGKDLYGDFLPVTIGGVGYVAIPAYLSALPTVFFGFNEQAVRLVPVLFGTIEILLLYGIAQTLFKSKTIALFSAAILAFSTWGLKMSRTMFDPPTSLFFYLLGIYLFLKATTTLKITLAWICLIIGTLSYYGSLFIFPFVTTTLVLFRKDFFLKNRSAIVSSLVVLIIGALILSRMLFTPGQNSRSFDRNQEIIFLNTTKIEDNVIFERLHSTGPEILNQLFINKATYVFRTFMNNYLGAFSPLMIFINGDPNRTYSLWTRGELRLLDLPLILIGGYFLIKRWRPSALFVFALILIAPISSGLSGRVYATRSFLLWPFLILLAGVGLTVWWQKAQDSSRKYLHLLLVVFLISYMAMSLSMVYQYFYRFPTYAKEIWFDSEKQLAFYLMNHPEKITIYSPEARQAFMEYFFFSKLNPETAQKVLTKNNIKGDIILNNLTFVNSCLNPGVDSIDHKVIVHANCIPTNTDLAGEIIRARDQSSQEKWYIFDPASPLFQR